MLESLQFTIYVVQDQAELSTLGKEDLYPLTTLNVFHSQFQLKFTEYRDVNNFLRVNNVVTHDDRIMVWRSNKLYQFIDFVQTNPWTSNSEFRKIRRVSYDKLYFEQKHIRLLYGAYFFLSEEKIDHQRFRYNIVNLASNVGGLFSVIFGTVGILVMFINTTSQPS